MITIRKKIRKILNEMGFDNGFLIRAEPDADVLSGMALHVIIKDWKADPKALDLKRMIERGLPEKVVVSFTGHGIACSTIGSGDNEKVVCRAI